MNVLFIIPARGGSKGIPRKNLRELAGKPLVHYTIKNALNAANNGDVYVSSDDDEILSIAAKIGAKGHKRADVLAGDDVTLDEVIFKAYEEIAAQEGKQYDLIVTLQPTSPLLKVASIEEAIARMAERPEVETLISARNDTHLTWKQADGAYVPNYTERVNRQFLEPVFKETGGFLMTRNTVISSTTRIGKNVELFELPPNEAIDIDTFEDWNSCEYHLRRKRIVFSVSGYPAIGLGHVYNTLIIANSILDHELLFFCDSKSELAFKAISEKNYPCYIQQGPQLVEEILALHPDVVVNDRLDSTEEDVLPYRSHGVQVINFEDLGSGARKADLVFNAIYPEKEKIKGHHFGPEFFCARDEFLLTKPRELQDEVRNVLVTFGGTDPNGLTLKVIESVLPVCQERHLELNVVTGPGFKDDDALGQIVGIRVHRNVGNISDHMRAADVAFTSAGRTTYELALLGVPSIVLAQNKRELTHFFAKQKFGFQDLGIGVEASAATIRKKFEELLVSKEKRAQMREKMLQTDLRNGKYRVLEKIRQLVRRELL